MAISSRILANLVSTIEFRRIWPVQPDFGYIVLDSAKLAGILPVGDGIWPALPNSGQNHWNFATGGFRHW
jgi:hypothetical protein